MLSLEIYTRAELDTYNIFQKSKDKKQEKGNIGKCKYIYIYIENKINFKKCIHKNLRYKDFANRSVLDFVCRRKRGSSLHSYVCMSVCISVM